MRRTNGPIAGCVFGLLFTPRTRPAWTVNYPNRACRSAALNRVEHLVPFVLSGTGGAHELPLASAISALHSQAAILAAGVRYPHRRGFLPPKLRDPNAYASDCAGFDRQQTRLNSDDGPVKAGKPNGPSRNRLPANDDPAKCPLCQAVGHAGQFVWPQAALSFAAAAGGDRSACHRDPADTRTPVARLAGPRATTPLTPS